MRQRNGRRYGNSSIRRSVIEAFERQKTWNAWHARNNPTPAVDQADPFGTFRASTAGIVAPLAYHITPDRTDQETADAPPVDTTTAPTVNPPGWDSVEPGPEQLDTPPPAAHATTDSPEEIEPDNRPMLSTLKTGTLFRFLDNGMGYLFRKTDDQPQVSPTAPRWIGYQSVDAPGEKNRVYQVTADSPVYLEEIIPPSEHGATAGYKRAELEAHAEVWRASYGGVDLGPVSIGETAPAPSTGPENVESPTADPAIGPPAPDILRPMTACLNRAELAEALKTLRPFAPTKSPKPVLAMVRIRSNDQADVYIEATDLEMSASVRLWSSSTDTHQCRPDALLVDYATLSRYVKEAGKGAKKSATPQDILTLTRNAEGVVTASWGSVSGLPIKSDSPDLYPELPGADETQTADRWAIPAEYLHPAITRNAYAIDESTRYALGALALEIHPRQASGYHQATMVATDGRRLACSDFDMIEHRSTEPHDAPADAKSGQTAPILLPARFWDVIARRIEPDKTRHNGQTHETWHGATVDLYLIRAHVTDATTGETIPPRHTDPVLSVRIETGSATFSCRVHEGRFPLWRDVFPTAPLCRIQTTADELRQMAEAGALISNEEAPGVNLVFTPHVFTVEPGAGAFTVEPYSRAPKKMDDDTAARHAAALLSGMRVPYDNRAQTRHAPLLSLTPTHYDAIQPVDYWPKAINREILGIGFTIDPLYLLDAVKTFKTDRDIELEITDQKNAIVLTQRINGATHRAVIMPLTPDR